MTRIRSLLTLPLAVALTAPPTTAGWVNTEEMDLECNGTQFVDYQVGGGGESLTVDVLGWQE